MKMIEWVEQFLDYGVKQETFSKMDKIFMNNQIFALVGDISPELEISTESYFEKPTLAQRVSVLVEFAISNAKIENTQTARDILEAQLMSLITPLPSQLNQNFWQKYADTPQKATDYFFKLSQDNDYIKTASIAKNIAYQTSSEYGNLEITINLSKPEKDPKEIAKAKSLPSSSYPKCQLCFENEGYLGRANHPARSNHRIIRMTVDDESWGLQYSPYAYYNEHCIFLNSKHIPMKINRDTFVKLMALITQFPHYFAGSNADLPIVGGSILSHDHYQGGRHTFPMAVAPVENKFQLPNFPQIKAGIVKWPMSVIRLESANSTDLIAAATHILEKWQTYSDETVDIRAFTDDENTPHHTITPIARRNGKNYQLDLVLRDNQTSEQFPDGIFHPHQDVQHIKRENIGLIEVMGLAILPARLKTELSEVEKYLLNQPNQIAQMHLAWAKELKNNSHFNKENVHEQVQKAVGDVFLRVLEDAGVYKRTPIGQEAFNTFIATL